MHSNLVNPLETVQNSVPKPSHKNKIILQKALLKQNTEKNRDWLLAHAILRERLLCQFLAHMG